MLKTWKSQWKKLTQNEYISAEAEAFYANCNMVLIPM